MCYTGKVQLLSQYALSLLHIPTEGRRIEDLRYVRRDGRWVRGMPEVGDHVWFIGEEIKELMGELEITSIRENLGQVTVRPIGMPESTFNGWAVWWKDITYEEPESPSEEYLHG